jgi:hypothetical protein
VGFHPNPDAFANFLVWLEDGHVACLEGASVGAWPSDEENYVVTALPVEAQTD